MHNIHYIVCEEKENRASIMGEICSHALEDGDGYSSKMTWHDHVAPLESYEAAQEFIKRHDNGWYDDHAVRFLDYSDAKRTSRLEELAQRSAEICNGEREYRNAHSIHKLKAQFIGCPVCKSRLNKDCIVGEHCPLCRTDLRSKTTIEKLDWYKAKIAEYHEKIEVERRKQKDKARVKWLIKYEYHS